MQRVYYSLMAKLAAFLLLAGLVAAVIRPATQNGQQSSTKTRHPPYTDTHEGMTVAADPWTNASRYKEKFPKKSPFTGGVVAVDVSFRNDNDKGVKVDLQRLRLVVEVSEDSRQELEPLSPDDVADTVLLKQTAKDPTAHRSPLPIPSIGKPKGTRDSNWTNFRDACQNAAVPSGVIGAHSTVAGLVYFDIRGEIDLLQTARLYVPNLLMMQNNQPISYFDIALGHGTTDGETSSQ
jgi:hypothetical protein